MMKDWSIIINELGEERSEYFQAVAPPIIQSSNFSFPDVASLRKAFSDEFSHHLYTRGKNPTVEILCKKLAALDEAEEALVLSSGTAAISVAVMSFAKAGMHVICIENPYSWTNKLFANLLEKYNVSCTFVKGTQISDFENAILPETGIIFLESPNSFTYEIQDLKAVAELAKSKGIITMIDNTFCTPLFQKPHTLGVDICIQSASKYIGGHSDTIAGVITGSRNHIKQIFANEFMNIGAVISPFDAWLLIRGLRTMEIRLERIQKSTVELVSFCKSLEIFERVLWPFDADFPQVDLAKRQMTGCGGLFTVVMKTHNPDEIELFCNSLKHFLMAVSWGGHESLIIPWCATMPQQKFDANIERHRMVRFYIGLENPEILKDDIKNAMKILA